MDTHYTFGTSANAYFNGHDLRIRWEDRSLGVIVNEKDGMLAIDVKDRDTIHNTPLASQAAAKKIGDTETQHVYESVQMDFWQWAGEACKEYGFETVYQAGRSGGWLAVAGTENIPGSELIEPGEEDEDLRDRFLAFAFAVEQAIEGEGGYKQQFYAALVAAGENHRETVDCPNCGEQLMYHTEPSRGHAESCVLVPLLRTIEDRGELDLKGVDVSTIDVEELWDKLGPIVDDLEQRLGGGERSIGGGKFGEFSVDGFAPHDQDGASIDGIVSLGSVPHYLTVEDKAGNHFKVIGYGPVQGSVEVANKDDERAYVDVSVYVQMVGE